MFFCEFCDISKNTFPYRTRLVVASETENSKNTLGLKEKIITEELKLLRNKFVIISSKDVVSSDKASGNVAFVRQRHSAQILINVLVWITLIPGS